MGGGASRITEGVFSDYGYAWNLWILRSLWLGFGFKLLCLLGCLLSSAGLGDLAVSRYDSCSLATHIGNGTLDQWHRGVSLSRLPPESTSSRTTPGWAAAAISNLILRYYTNLQERQKPYLNADSG